jgi:hypothetical protein
VKGEGRNVKRGLASYQSQRPGDIVCVEEAVIVLGGKGASQQNWFKVNASRRGYGQSISLKNRF